MCFFIFCRHGFVIRVSFVFGFEEGGGYFQARCFLHSGFFGPLCEGVNVAIGIFFDLDAGGRCFGVVVIVGTGESWCAGRFSVSWWRLELECIYSAERKER